MKFILLLLLCLFDHCIYAQLNYHHPASWTLDEFSEKGKQKKIRLPGGPELDYAETGSENGTPVIFLHGFTDSWQSFGEIIPLLPSNIHAFYISQRGHGNSGKPVSGYAPHDFSEDVAAFMNALRIGPAIIVGHSMGGVIAMRFVLDHPELSRALVIISSDPAFGKNAGMDEFFQLVSTMKDPIDRAFVDGFQRSTVTQPISAEFYESIVSESMKVPARVWKQALAGLMKIDLLSELNKIIQPTLILWGNKDSFITRESQQKLVAGIKYSSLVIYEEIGHALHWEAPQRFTRDLLSFINVVDTIE